MQREIKFRIWDKHNKKLFSHEQILGLTFNLSFTDRPNLTMPLYQFLLQHQGGDNQQKNYIVQQFTCLKDKNGKEIYEGDIVKYKSRTRFIDNNNTPKKEIGIIIWKNESFKIDMFNPSYPDERYYSIKQNDIEVIGNIYENPKLMEEK